MISRRRFLGAGTIAAMGAAVGSVTLMRDAYAKGKSGMQTPAREFFEKLTGTTFQVHQDALRSVPLRLAEVRGPSGRVKALPGHDPRERCDHLTSPHGMVMITAHSPAGL